MKYVLAVSTVFSHVSSFLSRIVSEKKISNIPKVMMFVLLFLFAACGNEQTGSPIYPDDGLSSNYYIRNITFSAGTLQYQFSPHDWTNYLTVPYATSSITVTVEKDHIRSTIFVNGQIVDGGVASNPINLNVGNDNVITMRVVAEDGLEWEYIIYVTRQSENYAVARLSELLVEGVTLNPAFNPEDSARNFSAIVSAATISLCARAFAENEGASVAVLANDEAVADGGSIALNPGSNTIEITVTAPDGTTKETYGITLVRQTDSNTSSKLVLLSIAGGAFNEGTFNPDTTTYTINVPSSINPVNLTAIPESSLANVSSVTLNDAEVADRTAIPLPPGVTSSIVVTVTAGNATTTKYTINATSLAGSDNAKLKNISVIMGTKSVRPLYPGTFVRGATYHNPGVTTFSPDICDYVTVIYGFNTIKLTATADYSSVKGIAFTVDGASERVGGATFSGNTGIATITLNTGLINKVDVTVTADDGTTQKIYTVYAKLLNIDEFYWGIYAPPMSKAYTERWEPKPIGSSKTVNGLVSGTLFWKTTAVPVTNNMVYTNYNDGKYGFNYNDGGFVANGNLYAELPSLNGTGYQVNKDGSEYTLTTPEGELVGKLAFHLKIMNQQKVAAPDSYTDITDYLGDTKRQIYRETNPPYPFTDTYDWSTGWVVE